MTGNLAYNDANQLAIAKAGAIPALVSLIIKSTPTAMERAISAIGNLAFNDINRKAIPKAGAIAPLVFLLSEGNPVMQEQAALALGEFLPVLGSLGVSQLSSLGLSLRC